MTDQLTIDQACEKYGFEKKKLIGHCMRNDLEDPLVIDRAEDGNYLVADDWRLSRLAKQSATGCVKYHGERADAGVNICPDCGKDIRAANKSFEGQK